MRGHCLKRGEVGPTFRLVLAALDGETKADELCASLGLAPAVVHATLSRAVSRGLAVRVGFGLYRRRP